VPRNKGRRAKDYLHSLQTVSRLKYRRAQHRCSSAWFGQEARGQHYWSISMSTYDKNAVDKEIGKDPRIKGAEAKAIHALLKGPTSMRTTVEDLIALERKTESVQNELLLLTALGAGWSHGDITDKLIAAEESIETAKLAIRRARFFVKMEAHS
jgi:hypothetical protein